MAKVNVNIKAVMPVTPVRTRKRMTARLVVADGTRTYRCPEKVGDKSCSYVVMWPKQESKDIPACPTHKIQPKLCRKSQSERFREAVSLSKMRFGGWNPSLLWTDTSTRTSQCILCSKIIPKNTKRVVIDSPDGSVARNGFRVARRRQMVHFTCFIDVLMDGHPGRGCPGCTAKINDREFRDYRKWVQNGCKGDPPITTPHIQHPTPTPSF